MNLEFGNNLSDIGICTIKSISGIFVIYFFLKYFVKEYIQFHFQVKVEKERNAFQKELKDLNNKMEKEKHKMDLEKKDADFKHDFIKQLTVDDLKSLIENTKLK
jgi:ABC-type lipoprotein release transport system permease subunit